jgi:hypothetical protein
MSGSTEQQQEEAVADEVCANCGKAAVDNIKLKKCACDLVKYCSVDCQKNNRPIHKKACKKRLVEIRDDKLFTQPDQSHLGECPICCLPLPLDTSKSTMMSCCCKLICDGCSHANMLRELEQGLESKCTFCREPIMKTDEETEKDSMKRVKANDPVALCHMGNSCNDDGNYEGALQCWTKAAELGNAMAHFNLSLMYQKGLVVEKDMKKSVYHLEEAAIGGYPDARCNLGCYEGQSGRHIRAMKHFIIAAKLGHDNALEAVKDACTVGLAKKEDYETALRGHQAAVDATKSQQRDLAEEWFKKRNVH